jgi:triosephosphate isomerase (TIM)
VTVKHAGGGRVPLIAGNWKMHKTSREGALFITQLRGFLGHIEDRQVLLAPPFTGLCEAVSAAAGSGIIVSSQDVFWESEGAFTGEVSAGMLADLGVKAAIVGHSERRQYFGETDEMVGKKAGATLRRGMLAVVCVGETGEEREAGLTERVLATQIPAALRMVRAGEMSAVAIAYEPIWAIGTGKTATPATAQLAAAFVRAQVAALLGAEDARMVRVLYGGSVNPDNIDELMRQPDIDGVLAGGSSLQLESFARIVNFRRD